jgi:hypothetical protein
MIKSFLHFCRITTRALPVSEVAEALEYVLLQMAPDDGRKFIHGKPTAKNVEATKFWASVEKSIAELDVNLKPGLASLKKRTNLYHFFSTSFKEGLPKERVDVFDKLKVKETPGRRGEAAKQLSEGKVLEKILLGQAKSDNSQFILGASFKNNEKAEKFWTNVYNIIQTQSGDDEGLIALRKRSSAGAIAQFFHKTMLESGEFEFLGTLR